MGNTSAFPDLASVPEFDSGRDPPYKPSPGARFCVSEDLCAVLATRQPSQASLEASALAHLALTPDSGQVGDQATNLILNVQNPNGSWPVFLGPYGLMEAARKSLNKQ
jgi:hypothetical protein